MVFALWKARHFYGENIVKNMSMCDGEIDRGSYVALST